MDLFEVKYFGFSTFDLKFTTVSFQVAEKKDVIKKYKDE